MYGNRSLKPTFRRSSFSLFWSPYLFLIFRIDSSRYCNSLCIFKSFTISGYTFNWSENLKVRKKGVHARRTENNNNKSISHRFCRNFYRISFFDSHLNFLTYDWVRRLLWSLYFFDWYVSSQRYLLCCTVTMAYDYHKLHYSRPASWITRTWATLPSLWIYPIGGIFLFLKLSNWNSWKVKKRCLLVI